MTGHPPMFSRSEAPVMFAKIDEMRKGGRTWPQIAAALGQAPHSLQIWYDRRKEAQPLRKEFKIEFKRRKCLRCGQMFDSEGPHNRLCNHCNGFAQTVAPNAI